MNHTTRAEEGTPEVTFLEERGGVVLIQQSKVRYKQMELGVVLKSRENAADADLVEGIFDIDFEDRVPTSYSFRRK